MSDPMQAIKDQLDNDFPGRPSFCEVEGCPNRGTEGRATLDSDGKRRSEWLCHDHSAAMDG